MPEGDPATSKECPLYVDCDGTLVTTDLLHECLARELVGRPWAWPRVLLAGMRGRATLKRYLADRQPIAVASLPYRPEILERLHAAKAAGRRVVLATAGDHVHAQAVSDHLGVFDGVLASDGEHNLKGRAKLAAIQADAQGPFAYAGDATADLPIWEAAQESWVVTRHRSVVSAARRRIPTAEIIGVRGGGIRDWLRLIRPHQWAKNALLIVPMLLAHRLGDPGSWAALGLAFVAMSLAASGIYVFNDLVDIERDRAHRTKHRRPLAAGRIPVLAAPVLGVGLVSAALTVAYLTLPGPFSAWLAIYLGVTIAYSAVLKQAVVIDVMTLAGLYCLRIVAGAAAVDVGVSHWLLGLSLFLFTSLALCKRYTELAPLLEQHGDDARARGYRATDLPVLESAGVSSGLIAVLVLALFIHSNDVGTLYRAPWALWLICPLLLYWILRVWFAAARGTMHDDPVMFALKDRASLVVGVLVLALVIIAARDPFPALMWLVPGHG